MDQDKNFSDLVKEAYQKLEDTEKELGVMLSEIQKEKGHLNNYLRSLGIVEIKKRDSERRMLKNRRNAG